MPRPTLSVVICTYNRSDLLAGVLHSICRQKVDGTPFEIIVVDNNSADDTPDVSQRFCRDHAHVRYCLEEKQGLSHARNRGWREARGAYVAYIDDDCIVPDHWLRTALGITETVAPDVFGGPFYAFFNTARPAWFKFEYGSHVPFKTARMLSPDDIVQIFGGHMFFRRELLERINGFDTTFGMSGNKLGYGEETNLLQTISKTMPDTRFYYDPALYLFHLVQARKMTLAHNIRSRFVLGGYTYRLFQDGAPAGVSRKHLLKQGVTALIRLLKSLSYGLLTYDRAAYPFAHNYLYEHTLDHIARLGRLLEIYRRVNENP